MADFQRKYTQLVAQAIITGNKDVIPVILYDFVPIEMRDDVVRRVLKLEAVLIVPSEPKPQIFFLTNFCIFIVKGGGKQEVKHPIS